MKGLTGPLCTFPPAVAAGANWGALILPALLGVDERVLLRETLVLEEEWEEKRHAAGQSRVAGRSFGRS